MSKYYQFWWTNLLKKNKTKIKTRKPKKKKQSNKLETILNKTLEIFKGKAKNQNRNIEYLLIP